MIMEVTPTPQVSALPGTVSSSVQSSLTTMPVVLAVVTTRLVMRVQSQNASRSGFVSCTTSGAAAP